MKKPRTIRFDPQQLKAVLDYCEITGSSPEAALREALEDWLECCAGVMLADFVEKAGQSLSQTN